MLSDRTIDGKSELYESDRDEEINFVNAGWIERPFPASIV
jgi:hypothetical protein